MSREIKKGTTIQLKDVNGYLQKVEKYYADTGQAVYDKNRKKSQSKGLEAFLQKILEDFKRGE